MRSKRAEASWSLPTMLSMLDVAQKATNTMKRTTSTIITRFDAAAVSASLVTSLQVGRRWGRLNAVWGLTRGLLADGKGNCGNGVREDRRRA